MANRYWIAGSAGNWNDTANWSTTSGGSGGASVPGASDDVIFDTNGAGNCTVNVNINVLSITLSSYVGAFDTAGFDVALGAGGLVVGSGLSSFDAGSGTWTISGNVDVSAATSLPSATYMNVVTAGSFTWTALGSSDIIVGDLTVSSGDTLTCSSGGAWLGPAAPCTWIIAGTLHNTAPQDITIGSGSGLITLTVQSTGVMSGITKGYVINAGTNLGFDVTVDGQITKDLTVRKNYNPGEIGDFSGTGSITGTTTFTRYGGSGGDPITLGSSVPTFNHLVLNDSFGGTGVVDAATNSPNLTVTGDFLIQPTTSFGWSAGTGTITLDNTAAQAIDFDGQTVEAVIVSNASTGAITLGANFTTPYVHDCNNLINLNGFTITETGTDPSPCVSYAGYYLLDEPFKRL